MSLAHDRAIIADLVSQLRDRAALPRQYARDRRWRDANSLHPRARANRPPVLVWLWGFQGDFEGGLLPPPALQCAHPDLRALEERLRFLLYRDDHFLDDFPVASPVVTIPPVLHGQDDWGVAWRISERTQQGGAWHYEPVIHTPADLEGFTSPVITYDAEATQRECARMQYLVGDVLPVEIGKCGMPTFHLIARWCLYRGLEQVMIDMSDDPDFLHAGMQIMAEYSRQVAMQLEALGLLPQYYEQWNVTDDLPQADYDPTHIRLKDGMAWAESQELTGVSPAMHEEFALRYERPLMEMFGLSSYGCCEDLTHKIDMLRSVKNLRQIGVTPWADVCKCVEQIGTDYAISWRPNPAHLAGDFDEGFIRSFLREHLEMLKGTAFHIFLKDIHALGGEPDRLTRWAGILREEIDRLWEPAA